MLVLYEYIMYCTNPKLDNMKEMRILEGTGRDETVPYNILISDLLLGDEYCRLKDKLKKTYFVKSLASPN